MSFLKQNKAGLQVKIQSLCQVSTKAARKVATPHPDFANL